MVTRSTSGTIWSSGIARTSSPTLVVAPRRERRVMLDHVAGVATGARGCKWRPTPNRSSRQTADRIGAELDLMEAAEAPALSKARRGAGSSGTDRGFWKEKVVV